MCCLKELREEVSQKRILWPSVVVRTEPSNVNYREANENHTISYTTPCMLPHFQCLFVYTGTASIRYVSSVEGRRKEKQGTVNHKRGLFWKATSVQLEARQRYDMSTTNTSGGIYITDAATREGMLPKADATA